MLTTKKYKETTAQSNDQKHYVLSLNEENKLKLKMQIGQKVHRYLCRSESFKVS